MKKVVPLLLVLILTAVACTVPAPSPTLLPTEPPVLPTATPTLETITPRPTERSVITSLSLLYIDFLDEENGWARASSDTGYAETHTGSPGYILRTFDGGSTWYDFTPPGMVDVYYAAQLTVFDINTAWVLVPEMDYSVGTLYHTVDGGETWTSGAVPFGSADMQFLDPMVGRAMVGRGVAAGSDAVEIFQTSDGGVTWTSVFVNDPIAGDVPGGLPFSGDKNGMTFLDADTGWITGSRPVNGEVYFYVTHDGGSTWAMQPISLPSGFEANQYTPYSPFFFGQDGYLPLMIYFPVGNTELLFYVTHDGGLTWTGDPTSAYQVVTPGHWSFPDASTGFVWDGGTNFLFTTEGAQSWTGVSTSLDLSDSLASIDFVDSTTGWALTGPNDSGLTWLYRTDDGGGTWTQLIP